MPANAAVREVLLPFPPSRCPVDADGVPAEWIEVTAATVRQPTLVCFPGPGSDGVDLATRLAANTGARVLTVSGASVEDGIAAWRWLLREGCDTRTTTFVGTPAGSVLAFDVLAEAEHCGLALPEGGVWTVS
ncbi:MAG TPA: hypothetical protein VEG38_07270 [Acidimicrobiia bacterium]|nr:hypothetical protein [Acidimicrobiia bacterium]